ncbi:MAG TPA: glycine C-acetyltransferase [Clostridiaceae bacterium]|jgi:glycine C-acetyltransferase|nr:glycine C-acetyltransferase [Clostridiaceae bacterium]
MKKALEHYAKLLQQFKDDGIYKNERIITTVQGAHIDTINSRNVISMCANNYLGFSNHPAIREAAKEGMDRWGYGLSSVRFICGTQQIHQELERRISEFLGTDDTILYSSCFDANGGLFETLLDAQDCVISDSLNHASIIDGIRLCKARRLRYANNDMADLERCLREAVDARIRLIATDGVFSMDGTIADLQTICHLAEQYDALVMVDDSHAAGFMGPTGRGTPELCGVSDKVDIYTGTLGKAFGGASGGYTSGRQAIIDLLRQKSRPYLFSNTVAPAIVCGSLKALEICMTDPSYRGRLHENTGYYREQLRNVGFDVIESTHPIVAILFYDARVAAQIAERMLQLGVYVVGFWYPVVPQGKARIRTQVSAAHTREDLDFVVSCFAQAKKDLGI